MDNSGSKFKNRIKISLKAKFILFSAPVFVLLLMLVGNLTENLLERQVLLNADQLLLKMSQHEAEEIDKYFKRIENLGYQSASTIKNWITSAETLSDKDFNQKYKIQNDALRTNLNYWKNKDVSGVFLSSLSPLTDEIKKIILSTEGKFEEYAKATRPTVFNMYLITKHQLIRIYEKDWALEIESDHDFNYDIFYSISTPGNNPSGNPKWTDPYYDSIWKRWMISLITPIYINNKFLGVVGHDVVLDDIYRDVVNKKYYSSGYGFIFDSNKNIVVHPKYLSRFQQQAEMGTLLSQDKFGDNLIRKLISDIVDLDNSNLSSKKVYEFKDEKHYIYTSKLKILNWYYSIEITKSEFLKSLPSFRYNYFLFSIIATILIYSIIVFLVWFIVLKPIKKLKTASEKISSGDYDLYAEESSLDEIGDLSKAFNKMIGEVKLKIEETNTTKENYKRVLTNSVEGIYLSTLEGKFKKINPAGAAILGYENEEEVISKITDISSQLYVNNFDRQKSIENYVEGGNAIHYETQVYKKDKSIIWVEIRERVIKDEENNITMFEGFFNDITERKRSEEILTISNTILKTQQQTSPDGILIVDENQLMVDYNQKFSEMWGIPDIILQTKNDEEARNYIAGKLVHPDKFSEKVNYLYKNPKEKSYDIIELKGGTYFERFSAPLISSEGKNFGRIWYFRDITETRRFETELINAKDKAEKSEKLKSEFLAQVSHEVRTPINAILSFSQLIKEELTGQVEDELGDCFTTIDQAGRRIIRTIDLILNMSEIQTGSYDYISKSVNLYDNVIKRLYEEYKYIASSKNIGLKVTGCEIDQVIEADEYTVIQIFANLIDNAVKYTHQGFVEIIIKNTENPSVIIKDTGIGIDKDYIPIMFNEFTQEDQGYTRKYEGNGLGLALVKKYCELNDAEIFVESEKDKGTSIKIVFMKKSEG